MIFTEQGYLETRYVYSVSATRRILDLEPDHRVKIRQLQKVVWVHAQGQRPTFISKKLYKRHFAQYRFDSSFAHQASQLTDRLWTVDSSQSKRNYEVTLSPEVTCTCSDFRVQEDLRIKTPCCKHIYCVLGSLGYSSLRTFINDTKAGAVAA